MILFHLEYCWPYHLQNYAWWPSGRIKAKEIPQKINKKNEKKNQVLKKRQGKEKKDKDVSGHHDTNRNTKQVPILFQGI